MSQARVIVISSVSGGGKTTLINKLREQFPDLRPAITATTRKPRPGELDGDHYYFYSKEAFEKQIAAGGFLEHAFVHGNHYGVPRPPVEAELQKGNSVILNIDVQGMRAVKEQLSDRVFTVFILPPDMDIWEERLRSRKTESEEQLKMRLQQGALELEAAFEYDYRIMNKDLNRAVQELIQVLRKEAVID
ncbi:MAG: guanylate kinase [Leptospiraceae bacterium]|nr:guanylate kinase [Leptospiraceae bacterium]